MADPSGENPRKRARAQYEDGLPAPEEEQQMFNSNFYDDLMGISEDEDEEAVKGEGKPGGDESSEVPTVYKMVLAFRGKEGNVVATEGGQGTVTVAASEGEQDAGNDGDKVLAARAQAAITAVPMLIVTIGSGAPGSNSVMVSNPVLLEHWPYAMALGAGRGLPVMIKLKGVHAFSFDFFKRFLTTGLVTFHVSGTGKGKNSFQARIRSDCGVIEGCWALAEKLGMTAFTDATTDTFIAMSERTLVYTPAILNRMRIAANPAFKHKSPPIRWLMVRIAMAYWTKFTIHERRDDARLPSDLVADMLYTMEKDKITGVDPTRPLVEGGNSCEFHEHNLYSTPCYRTMFPSALWH